MNDTTKSFLGYHRKARTFSLEAPLSAETWPDEWRTIYFKGYPRFARIPLPTAHFSSSLTVQEAVRSRHSNRHFASDTPLTVEELSRILVGLELTGGSNESTPSSSRAYASAGGRYPIEAYILPLKIETLSSHVFHYHVRSHSLEELWQFSQEQFANCFPHDAWLRESAAAIVLTACHGRTSMKYGDRAYQFCLLEAGEIAQNIQLLCAAERFACCSFGGGADDAIMRLLDINPNEELVMHVLFVGKPSLTP
jgi:SagB-type dehydrogenase family enzyme